LLLQLAKNSSYAKWLALFVRDHALYKFAKHTNFHAVLELDKLNDAIRGLHAMHIYDVNLKELNDDMFYELVKKLVS